MDPHTEVAQGVCAGPPAIVLKVLFSGTIGAPLRQGLGFHHMTLTLPGLNFLICPREVGWDEH